MIGHYLLQLTPEQEDRVLTLRLRAGWYTQPDNCFCLRGAAEMIDRGGQVHDPIKGFSTWRCSNYKACGDHFDALSFRFGQERINHAIRMRILANRAQRVLAQQREEVLV